jgi:hypothetical protein
VPKGSETLNGSWCRRTMFPPGHRERRPQPVYGITNA